MTRMGLIAGVSLALGAAGSAAAQPAPTASPAAVAARGQLGIVRVRIDPGVGEQAAEIRGLLAAHPFVRIGEPADYLVTTKPDFPLDIILYDLGHPPELWDELDEDQMPKVPEPRQHAVGNLRSEDTPQRLGHLLLAASRLRALLDRSLGDMQGVEACLTFRQPSTVSGDTAATSQDSPADCRPLGGPGLTIVPAYEVGGLRVRNRSNGERYVTTIAANGSLKAEWFGMEEDVPVRKLGPGESLEFQPAIVAFGNTDDPRILLLVSSRPFAVADLAQPAPLEPTEACQQGRSIQSCDPVTSAITLNDDLAVRSFQMLVVPEPMPAMGHGTDVVAGMAVWMAQFYSVLPYTPEEIAADSRLPENEKQFLALRNYQERQHRCGGTLIGPNLVLTAAHCVAKGQYAGNGLAKLLKDRRVRLGARKLGQGGQSFAIAGVAVHAGYVPDRQNHDVALLLLRPDRGSSAMRQQPIALASRPLPGAVSARAFGWGLTGAVGPDGNIMMTVDQRLQRNPDVLQYGEMISVTLDECRRKLPGRVAPGMVCMYSKAALAGAPSADGVFTCRGDSGGPLVRKVGAREELVGVVSWSMGCGFKQFPSVFTDAGRYAKWVAAARQQLVPGAAIRVAEPRAPSRQEGRPQAR